jgi:hypothetical protein
MPAGIPNEVYDFVKDIMDRMLRDERDSEDVTFKVFQRIDARPALLERYRRILADKDVEDVHKQMGKAVKSIDNRENAEINHTPPQLKNIRLTSYTRFKTP